MRLADLGADALAGLRRYRYDRIVEKHEGPWDWSEVLDYYDPEFLELAGHDVLLPLEGKHHPNVTLIRCVEGEGGAVLTLFLRDTTYYDDMFESGFLAVCERLPGESFYLATVYHEWFIIEN